VPVNPAVSDGNLQLDSERSGNHTTHNINGERRENKVLPKPHGPTSQSRYTFLTSNIDHTVKCDPIWHMIFHSGVISIADCYIEFTFALHHQEECSN